MFFLRLISSGLLLAMLMFAPVSGGALAQDSGPSASAYGQLPEVQSAAAAADAASSEEPTLADYGRVAEQLSMVSETQLSFSRFRDRSIALFQQLPDLPGDIADLLAEKSPTGHPIHFAQLIVWTLIFSAAAFLLVRKVYGHWFVASWFIAMQRPDPDGIVEKMPILAIRALLGFVGIILSSLVTGLLAGLLIDPGDEASQKTIIIVIATVAAGRASAVVWRMVLAPWLSEYRLPCLTDRDALQLFQWLWITIAFSLLILAICYWLDELGVARVNHHLLLILGSGLTVILTIMMMMSNRRAITSAFLGACGPDDASWLQRLSSMIWAPVGMLYFIAAWIVQTYRILQGEDPGAPLIVGAFVVLLAVIVAYGLVAYAIARLFHRGERRMQAPPTDMDTDLASIDPALIVTATNIEGDPLEGEGDEDSGPSATPPGERDRVVQARTGGMRNFEDLARRTASVVAVGAGLYALVWIWGMVDIFREGMWADGLEDIVDTCLVSYVIYHAVRIWIDMKIEEEGGYEISNEPDEGGAASSASRLATLLPLFRNFMLFVILTAAVLMVLLELGINVAPLFAGAGVLGLAIGFGAQALIRDILSGAFFLIDDAFRRGEYIDIGSVKGTVEKISIRSFQLRHHLGALHTVPFGEITHLTNYSRDWVMMKLPLRVTYDTDVEKVRKLVKKLGAELLEHPIEGPKFMQPLKSQGVYKMEDSAMILRIKYMTRPGDQWTTRKLVYSRMRELFAENGIKFAHREVTVRIPGHERLTDDEREAVAAAARSAADASEEGLSPRAVGDDR